MAWWPGAKRRGINDESVTDRNVITESPCLYGLNGGHFALQIVDKVQIMLILIIKSLSTVMAYP